MTMNWRLYDKDSNETIAIVTTDRSISLDDCITLAGFEAYEGPKVRPDDPDYISADGDEVWYDDLDYELM